MPDRTENKRFMLLHDAKELDAAARVIRRRMRGEKPAGVSLALFCRTLTMEATMCRAEAAELAADTGSSSEQVQP